MINKQSVEKFGKLEFLAKQTVEGFITGLHKSPYHGFSVEFAEHRLYNPGESTRHIDWKLFARTEKLFIKRYEEETNLRCQLVIDNSSSMYFPEGETNNKLHFSVHCAAALIELLRRQRDAVGVTFFNDAIEMHTQAKSSGTHHRFLYNELEKQLLQDQGRKTDVIQGLHQIAERVHKRSLVAIFSDMFADMDKQAELFDAIQHLKHNKHEVVVFHVVDQAKEMELDFENRPYVFVDMETKEEVRMNPRQVKDYFSESMNKYVHDLKVKCGQYRVDFVPCDIQEGFDKVLLAYLVKRKKMK